MLNETGYAYGASNCVSINRTYVPGIPRALTLYIDSSLQEAADQADGNATSETGVVGANQLWAVDVTLSYVKDVLVYPRFSTLYLEDFTIADGADVPDVTQQKTWSQTVAVTKDNAYWKLSDPQYTDNSDIWSDLLTAQG